jgi:sulfur carrier protein ThiS
MSTVQEEIQKDLPIERAGTVQDLIDPDKIAQGAVALTVDGRPYHKAAQELETMTKRRREVLAEYTALMRATHASLEELVMCHNRIDAIINELSRS